MRQETKRNFTLYYHDIFEYPLTKKEISLWQPGKKLGEKFAKRVEIEKKGEYSFLKGEGRLVTARLEREKISKRKLEIAKKGARIISLIPFVKMVAITGALAMGNARSGSDVDLFIICERGSLWITRLITILLLDTLGVPRNAGGRVERDKLCLNMWLDERDLIWDKRDRNFYTAHEIAQIIPLANKNEAYENFLYLNRWTRDYWPKAARQVGKNKRSKKSPIFYFLNLLIFPFEYLAFWFQYFYMKSKMTREVVTPTRAVFHPKDWGKEVAYKLSHLTK
ncbi:hypothetical protein A3E15_00150 [Candidatus Woesebacteria bacterium RIFCSPHIGHO2_12_FULL_42_9]|uniref:Polymerase nucleotidyl transferase domain-containing protein n=1 Tax=Candidatus Woesebacteria bacterium RIFCSPHIGHO2_12_FULL_42_9 TaxID=1802511 RepID=A0A1F8AWA3_9BACT|nr:MAG: hypothetical protein A3E15_00150 [Candidatus Woesebacteria bacterium RIFCSPHIGHO2_12_FULL_42_9]